MLFVLSPAKSLDEAPLADKVKTTQPLFGEQSQVLIDVLRAKSPQDIASLMHLSDKLSALNVARYQVWQAKPKASSSKPAALMFNGDVYDGLDAKSLDNEGLAWAQDHLCILSGLYGVLRPLDALQPYRLEMGTQLANPQGKNLYQFWGAHIAEYLNKRLAKATEPVLVNLASEEYFKAVDRRALKARVVTCVFEDFKGGRYKIISFFAKRARGLMMRWAIDQRVSKVEQLQGFDAQGYRFDADASSADRWVFRRQEAV